MKFVIHKYLSAVGSQSVTDFRRKWVWSLIFATINISRAKTFKKHNTNTFETLLAAFLKSYLI